MCGIAGLASVAPLAPEDAELVNQMLLTLAHRGPDDQQIHADASCILGARRLSIIDLETGRQPLANEDDSIWVAQNGEIYDYIELRDQLQAAGHRFRTKGDTETIVHAYEEYGSEFPRHLRGMFAISIWDSRRRRLILTRDRLGKKPIYWRYAGGRLLWGSEMKALLADPMLHRDVDPVAIAQYLQYQYIPSPGTVFSGVHKLPPASTLVWDGGEPRVSRYWDPTFAPKLMIDEESAIRETTALLAEAVRIRLRSDVPLGAFLSGGVDSSVVTALMVREAASTVRTFSIGFTEESHNELPYARAIAQHLGTDHSEDIVTIDAVELLPKLARHFDEPFADVSALPTYRVAEMAAKDVTVALSGDGGDESFGGYTRYAKHDRIARLRRVPSLPAVSGVAASMTASLVPRSQLRLRAETWHRLLSRDENALYVDLVSIGSPESNSRLLRDQGIADQREYLMAVLRGGASLGRERTLRADLLTYLPEGVLVKVDRATMASSLEARAPLLDHRVVEFAARLPFHLKVHRGETKRLLRAVAFRMLPRELIDRPKMGFGVPVDDWFRGSLGDAYSDLVLAPDARTRAWVEPRSASALLSEHRSGLAGHGHELWALLMLEQWARTWT